MKQQLTVGSRKYIQLPSWKKLILVTAMLLSEGSLVVVASGQVAHASHRGATVTGGNGGTGVTGGTVKKSTVTGGNGGAANTGSGAGAEAMCRSWCFNNVRKLVLVQKHGTGHKVSILKHPESLKKHKKEHNRRRLGSSKKA